MHHWNGYIPVEVGDSGGEGVTVHGNSSASSKLLGDINTITARAGGAGTLDVITTSSSSNTKGGVNDGVSGDLQGQTENKSSREKLGEHLEIGKEVDGIRKELKWTRDCQRKSESRQTRCEEDPASVSSWKDSREEWRVPFGWPSG